MPRVARFHWISPVDLPRVYWLSYSAWFIQVALLVGLTGVGWWGWGVSPTWVTPVGWAPLGGALVYGGLLVGTTLPPHQVGRLALGVSLGVALLVGSTLTSLSTGAAHVEGFFLVDPLGSPYSFLTVTLLPLVVLASLDSIRKNQWFYYGGVLLLGGILNLCFWVENFFGFYVLFELLGFPMFLLIGQYGPRAQRVEAAYKFFVYTFGGAAFILPVLVYLQWGLGSTSWVYLREYSFTLQEQILFTGLCAVPFGVKIPLIPFHLWLPEAHVEAPTPISMLLAGLLLKTGGYAFLRFIVPVFPAGVYTWTPAWTAVGLFSVVAGSVYATVQVDIKRIIAYASVAHMGVVFLGILAGPTGAAGATYLILAHGYTSAGLFGGIGVLYDRYHTRTIRYYGGLTGVAPLFGILFFLLTLSNLSFPFTGGFTGEFIILTGLIQTSWWTALGVGASVFLSLVYSMWLFNRIFGGRPARLVRHGELTPREWAYLGGCTVGSLGLGGGGAIFTGATHACYVQLFGGEPAPW